METLKKKLEEVAGRWDGDDSGLLEERGMEATELLDLIKVVEERAANLLNQ